MSASASALCGREGALVSVSISVDPRHLESLLEALAQLDFPINPQIYHDAALVYRFPDDHEETRGDHPGGVSGIRGAPRTKCGVRSAQFGFDPSSLHVTGMLDEIHAERSEEPAPAGAAYVSRSRE